MLNQVNALFTVLIGQTLMMRILRYVIEEDSLKIPDVSIVEASAELLYGLVHQRFILTRAGLHAMVSKRAFSN